MKKEDYLDIMQKQRSQIIASRLLLHLQQLQKPLFVGTPRRQPFQDCHGRQGIQSNRKYICLSRIQNARLKKLLAEKCIFLRPQPWPAGPSLGYASAEASGPRPGPLGLGRCLRKAFFSAHFSKAGLLILERQNIYSKVILQDTEHFSSCFPGFK